MQQLVQQAVAARFGAGHRESRSSGSVAQWLSDNGSIYTALDTLCTAEWLNLAPITTTARSAQSNGMSKAFVNTLKRDYVSGADRRSAAATLKQAPAWIADYKAVAPHSALGFRAPQQYSSEVLNVVSVGVQQVSPTCFTNRSSPQAMSPGNLSLEVVRMKAWSRPDRAESAGAVTDA